MTTDKAGSFYLGKLFQVDKKNFDDPFLYESRNLTTHAVCLGMTGSGKTGLAIALLEEAALSGLPALIIDPKGDMSNLMLMFPNLQPSDFLPWIDEAEASRKGQTPSQFAETTAALWKNGLAQWNEDRSRIQQLKDTVETVIYTPASQAGIPLSILNTFSAPLDDILLDDEVMRNRVLSTTSSLLGLLGLDADPIKSREHILISTIIDKAWRAKKDLDLPVLIQQIQKPPFDKVGVFDTETFFPQKERLTLAMSLNNLLASPGFQAWMEGEPLNIQSLLYTKEGKPRLAILSIAHLSDSERMFFVTLFLNELLGWVRKQSGTSSLRALLYMDEIFGYFPPSAMPPSKTPMLTLLKQARAFGLGVVLATQNPVDLDYKGLSNCGTWFIGRLQTERDKSRVIEGLNAASNGDLDTEKLNHMIATCSPRVFIARSIHLKEPRLFQTRWTMSYLRGPLTIPQIRSLMQGKTPQLAPVKEKSNTANKPTIPPGVEEYYLPHKQQMPPFTLHPKVLGIGKLHFVDTKNQVDVWKQYGFLCSATGETEFIQWEAAEEISSQLSSLTKEIPANATFDPLPAFLMQAKSYPLLGKALTDFLYQTQSIDLLQSKDPKMTSQAGETEAQFQEKMVLAIKDQLQGNVKKIQESYEKKIQTVQERLQKAIGKADTQKSQVTQRKMDTYISMGTTLIGALLGRGISKGSISQAGTSIRKAGRIGKEQEEAARAEESVETLQQQLSSLQAERDSEVAKASAVNPSDFKMNKISIRPRKGDIIIEKIALVWC